jgi:hypothetical protein
MEFISLTPKYIYQKENCDYKPTLLFLIHIFIRLLIAISENDAFQKGRREFLSRHAVDNVFK